MESIKMNKEQHKPYNAILELTFGCNRRCILCYKQLRDLKKGEFKFMSLETAKRIAEGLAPFDPIRIEFALKGEPLCNPHWDKIIQILRANLPQSQITMDTNGDFLTINNVKKFFKSGGNILSVDCYGNTLDERKELYKQFNLHIDGVYDGFDVFKRNNPKTTHEIVLVPDNFKNKQSLTRKLCNMAGSIDFEKGKLYGMYPLEKPLFKHCTKPFREISFLYNGDIKICCSDGNKDSKVYGNVYRTDIVDFWYNNKELNLIRTLLYNKLRIIYPCNKCDYYGGGRVGFLPKYKTIPPKKIEELWK